VLKVHKELKDRKAILVVLKARKALKVLKDQ
jgi:hypothetical protein